MLASTHPEKKHPGRTAPLADTEFVAVDTETTGLWWGDRVVEVGAVRFRGSTVIDRFRSLVNPRQAIPPEVTRIHRITDAMAARAPVAREVLPALLRFCEGAPCLAHFAEFDRGILATEFVRAGLQPPATRVYCTVALARKAWPELPRHGLHALVQHLGIPSGAPHRALADADAARQVFLAALPWLGERPTREDLDRAVGPGGRLTFRETTRALTALPHRLRALRTAIRHRRTVTVLVRLEHPAEGCEVVVARERVPEAVYTHGGEAWVDLRDPTAEADRVTSVPLHQIVAVRGRL